MGCTLHAETQPAVVPGGIPADPSVADLSVEAPTSAPPVRSRLTKAYLNAIRAEGRAAMAELARHEAWAAQRRREVAGLVAGVFGAEERP